MKKNCKNCKCLTEETETDSDGYVIGGGFHCEKQFQKAANNGNEDAYETNMHRTAYLEKSKVCFEARAI